MDPGLCGSCRHSQVVEGAKSTFWLCLRSRTDPSFPRYPPLPVVRCRGYELGRDQEQPFDAGGHLEASDPPAAGGIDPENAAAGQGEQ